MKGSDETSYLETKTSHHSEVTTTVNVPFISEATSSSIRKRSASSTTRNFVEQTCTNTNDVYKNIQSFLLAADVLIPAKERAKLTNKNLESVSLKHLKQDAKPNENVQMESKRRNEHQYNVQINKQMHSFVQEKNTKLLAQE
eukprot:scaffold136456_cov68-Attheya_sp.AAC.1